MKALLATYLLAMSSMTFAIPMTLDTFAETGENVWTFTDANAVLDDAGFHLSAQFGASNSTGSRSFGLYQLDIPSGVVGQELQIFSDAQLLTGSAATDVKLDTTDTTVTTFYGSIDYSLFPAPVFGFYFESDGYKAYSQPGNTADGVDHFGFYEHSGFTGFNYSIYAEDNDTGYSLDWVTMQVSDIQGLRFISSVPDDVPEPGTLALMSLGLFGLAMRLKR